MVVRQADFPTLIEILPDLSFYPIQTPYTIHANSLIFKGEDGRPFDVSFDSYEHYFIPHNINLNNSFEVDLKSTPIRVMNTQDLIKIYEVGLKGGNQTKIREYEHKINNLRFLKLN